VTVDPVLLDATDDDFCYLTTRGRVSGEPHEIEIWFARDGSTLYLMAGAGDRSDWVRNLRADAAVTVRVRDVTFAATARVVEAGTDEDALARRIVTDKFRPRYHGSLDDWQVRSLPVALEITGRA
jgi:deazaflavin-dependent oxidoreductase (nitroreductase family)